MTGASEHLIFNLELCKWIFCCLLIKQKHLVELGKWRLSWKSITSQQSRIICLILQLMQEPLDAIWVIFPEISMHLFCATVQNMCM